MKVLGLVGSSRKQGNTEIMVKEALLGAKEQGAEAQLLRLTDLHIKPCTGCMSWVFRGERCRLDDDMYFLLDEMLKADAFIIGAPTYVLSPAGIMKMIVDRVYMVSSVERHRWLGKKAATIAVAGIAGWDPFALSLLNVFPLSMGFTLVDTFLVHAPGPGEALLDDGNIERAHALGAAVCGKAPPPRRDDTPVCPLCRGSVFLVRGMNDAECPSCRIRGSFSHDKDSRLQFVAPHVEENRWTPESIDHHTESWVKFTEGRFKENLKEVMRRRKPYKEMDELWIKRGD